MERFQTGLAPIESGWLGWHLYLDNNNPSINLFKNVVNSTNEEFTEYKVDDKMPRDYWYNHLKRPKNYTIFPAWQEGGVNTLSEAFDKVLENGIIKLKDNSYDNCLEQWEWSIVNDDANFKYNLISPMDPSMLYEYTYNGLLQFYGDKETTDRIWDEIQFCKQMHELRPHQDELKLEVLEKVLRNI